MSRRNPTDPASLDADVVELSARDGDEEGLVTDIVSFFDADYVSPRGVGADFAKRAHQRAAARRATPALTLRR